MALEKSKSIEAELHTLGLTAVQPLDKLETIEEAEPAPKSVFQKIKLIFTNITVEPIMVCYILPCAMAALAVQNLNLEKACRVNLSFNETICDGLSARDTNRYGVEHEVAVQKMVASMNAWKNVVQSLIPSILLMFFGSWSDRNSRRKPCIMLPVMGELMSCTGFLICTYFFYQLPMEFNAISESVPPSLTGGWFCMFMGVYSYISSVSSVETRTLRIGAVSLFSNVSVTIGIALSGILYKKIGFYGVFGLSCGMYISGLLYGAFRVNEETLTPNGNSCGANTRKNFVKDFFDLKHISETFEVAFKGGTGNRKKRICTIMVLVMVIVGPLHGEMNVMYLFVRYKFGWNEMDYSIYSTFNIIVHIFGTVFSLMFFSKFLKLDDSLMGIISSLSKIASSVVYAFAPTPFVFYIGAIVEMFNGTSFIAMRSITSKLVPPEELGKINSLFGVSEALMPLIYGPMYSIVYNATIDTLPGSFLLLGGLLTTPAILIFFWLYCEHKKDKAEDERNNAQEEKLLNGKDNFNKT